MVTETETETERRRDRSSVRKAQTVRGTRASTDLGIPQSPANLRNACHERKSDLHPQLATSCASHAHELEIGCM